MSDSLIKTILISISVVLMSALISTISWTLVLGLTIAGDLQSDVITYYSEAGLSMMVDANNLESLDAANLYKMLEVNRNLIVDYSIRLLDGTAITKFNELLDMPLNRFKVTITGDSAVGFKVVAKEIFVERNFETND